MSLLLLFRNRAGAVTVTASWEQAPASWAASVATVEAVKRPLPRRRVAIPRQKVLARASWVQEPAGWRADVTVTRRVADDIEELVLVGAL